MSYINQLFDLSGKVAIVTGATGVLGGEMAMALAKAGAQVGILGRRAEVCEKMVTEIIENGGQAIALPADVLSEDQLIDARDKVIDKWGSIDILVNAAGGNMPGAVIQPEQSVFDLSMIDLKGVMDVNLMGTILPTQVFAKPMADKKKGSIINISSMAATLSITRVLGYTVSKSAIDGYTRWMSTEMAMKFDGGIRVNAIAPGFFIGEQNRRLLTNEDGSLTLRGQKVIDNTPFGRFGKPEELCGALIWLSSDASTFVTGTVIAVDGGFGSFSGV